MQEDHVSNEHLHASTTTCFTCVPLSHRINTISYSIPLTFIVFHCPSVSLLGQIHTTIFYGVPLSHHLIPMTNTHSYLLMCPTVSPSHCYDKYTNCLFLFPLSHCLITMTNTHHYMIWCPTVPPSHYHDKYTQLSFNVSHCPTISLL
jgi:hypothetical protein